MFDDKPKFLLRQIQTEGWTKRWIEGRKDKRHVSVTMFFLTNKRVFIYFVYFPFVIYLFMFKYTISTYLKHKHK